MTKIQEYIITAIGANPISMRDLMAVMNTDHPNIADKTIQNNIAMLKTEGVISASGGLYSIVKKVKPSNSIGNNLEVKLKGRLALEDEKTHAYHLSVLLQRFEQYNVDEPEIIDSLKEVIKYHE